MSEIRVIDEPEEWIRPLFKRAHSRLSNITDEEVDRALRRSPGIQVGDGEVFVEVNAYEIRNMVNGIVPVGLATHVKLVLPQRVDPVWAKTRLGPVLLKAFELSAVKWPEAIDRVCWARAARRLAAQWKVAFPTNITMQDFGRRTLVTYPTLRLAIDGMRADLA